MTNQLKRYFITIFITIIFLFSVCLCVELELLFRCEKRINQEEFQMENLEKFCTIDELEKKLKKEPTSYVTNLKLAQVYESLNENKKAHELYKSALKLSGRSNLTIYHFAMFCARQNLYALSSALCEELSGTNKKVIEYKTNIYEAIADNFMKNKEYPAANKAYQVAYKYAKNIGDKKVYLSIKDKYSDSYIKLADYHILNKEPELATSALENAVRIKETPYADYRLGLIYLDNDKKAAEKYISKAFKENPYIVNPFIYNKLLNDLIEETKEAKNASALNYYSMKLTRFKSTLKNSYIYKGDILVQKGDIRSYKKRFSKNKNYYITLDLKNNTKENFHELYLQVELFIDSDKYTVDKKVISNASPLASYDLVSDIRLPLEEEINLEGKKDITLKYYVKRKQKAPWTLIKIDSLNF